ARTESLSGRVMVLEIALFRRPVEDALFPDIEEAHQHKSEIDQHLPEAEETGAGDVRQLAINDGPGKHENGLHIEEDEQHGDHVKANGKTPPRIALCGYSALVGGQLGFGAVTPSDEPGTRRHRAAQPHGHDNLYQQRDVVPRIGMGLHTAQLASGWERQTGYSLRVFVALSRVKF